MFGANRLGVLGILGAFASVACAGSATESGSSDTTASEIHAPAQIADPDGKIWIRGAKIEYSNTEPVQPKGLKPEADVSKMTLAEATEYFRPRMAQGGYEYTLRYEDAQEMAATILAERTNPTHLGEAGQVPEGVAVADGNLDREAKTVLGTDDRININYAANTYPYNNHAQMLGGGHTCTAFKMVNNYTAVTAAHCVHSGSSFISPRKDLTFQAGSSTPKATLPGGCYAMTVPGCWDGDSVSCDYAVIRLRGGGPWCNFNDYNVGYLGYNTVSSCVTDIKAFLSGYPSDAPLPAGWVYPSLAYHYRSDGWTSCVTYPDRVWYNNDSTGGQSGTALVSYWSDGSWRVRGIHHGGDTGVFSNSNQGRRMTSDLYSWLSGNAGY